MDSYKSGSRAIIVALQ